MPYESVLTFACNPSMVNGVADKPGQSRGLYKSDKVEPVRDALAR
jgi:hypothetical protein